MEKHQWTADCATVTHRNQEASQSAVEQNQRALDRYNCEVYAWNREYQQALQGYENDKKVALTEFLDRVHAAIGEAQTQIECTHGTHIMEALYVASTVLQDAIHDRRFDNYILLIFSDMWEDRIYNSGDLVVDLSGVDVVVAMMYCNRAVQCQEREQRWNDELDTLGARSIRFLLVADSTPEVLVPIITMIRR